jgi:hypothetical protein
MLNNPCNAAANVRNTGSECSDALKAAAMLIMVPKNAKWTSADLDDFTAFGLEKTHAAAADRWFPIFGSSAPIKGIKEANEADVIETHEDGSVSFIRYGMYNRTFMTTEGGMCLAAALMGMASNYAFVEVDITGQIAMMENSDGTFSGFPVNLAYAPVPDLANLKTTYKNNFMLSFSPLNYIKKGKVFASDADEDLLSLKGLYDVTVYKAAAYTKAGATAATGSVTLTAVGADGDTIDIKVSGVSITGGPVTKTSAESTVTLLATKVALAITNAAATNGGFTAVGSVGAVNITAPAGLGATINTVAPVVTIVGTMTNSAPVAFSGGVTGTMVLKVGVKTTCGETDLLAKYPKILNDKAYYIVTNAAGTVIVISAGSYSALVENLTVPFVNGTYKVSLVAAATLKAAGVEGYESTTSESIVVLN